MELHEDSTTDKKPTPSDASTTPPSEPRKASDKLRVHVPVMVAIMVPVEIDAPCLDDDAVDEDEELAGIAHKSCEDGDEMIESVKKRVLEGDIVSDAMGALMAGAQLYQRDNPLHKIVMCPYWGVLPPMEL